MRGSTTLLLLLLQLNLHACVLGSFLPPWSTSLGLSSLFAPRHSTMPMQRAVPCCLEFALT